MQFPSLTHLARLFKLKTPRSLLRVHIWVTQHQTRTLRAKLIAILDNTGQPPFINTGISTCMCQNPQSDYKQIRVCITGLMHAKVSLLYLIFVIGCQIIKHVYE